MKHYFDTVILGLGIFFLAFGVFLLWERHVPKTFASPATVTISDRPTRISLPSLGIDLPVYPAAIHNSKWELSTDGISYLTTSPLPGSVGNSVFYGHNWPNLLGKLNGIKPGEEIKVWRGGNQLTFIVHFVSIVQPNQTHVYQNTLDSRLTLYTCTGLLDRQRLVVTAFPQ